MPLTPYNPFGEVQSKKEMAQKTERRLAKRLGGVAQPNSGAIAGFKGDVRLPDFLLDSKETDNASFSVTLNDLTKITREANGMKKHPALVVRVKTQSWVCLPLDVFEDMLKVWMKGRHES